MTITLAWWALPVFLITVGFVLCFAWPDEPSGHFMAGGPGFLKILVIAVMWVGSIGICIGKMLA